MAALISSRLHLSLLGLATLTAGSAAWAAPIVFDTVRFDQNFDTATSLADVSGNGVNQLSDTANAVAENSTIDVINGNLRYNRTFTNPAGGTLAQVRATTTNFVGGSVITDPFRIDVGFTNPNRISGEEFNVRFGINSGVLGDASIVVRLQGGSPQRLGFGDFGLSGKGFDQESANVVLLFNPTADNVEYTIPVPVNPGDPTTRILEPGTADAYFNSNFDAGFVTQQDHFINNFTGLSNFFVADSGFGNNVGSTEISSIRVTSGVIPEPAAAAALIVGLALLRRR